MTKRYKTLGVYAVSIILFSVALFLWVNQGSETKDTTKDTNVKVSEAAVTIEDLSEAVKDLRADHDGQDALMQCYFKLLVASMTSQEPVADVDIQNCVITTAVPSRTDAGTAPGGQTNAPAQSGVNQPGVSSSNNNTSSPPPQQNNPQSPPEEPPQPPDNDGVIIDLPLLPEVHIPSPL